MFILFGTRSYRETLMNFSPSSAHCCDELAGKRLVKAYSKFTLFFIPLFPISSKYYVECIGCGGAFKVTAEQANEMLSDKQRETESAIDSVEI